MTKSLFARIKDGRIYYYDGNGTMKTDHAFVDNEGERARLCDVARYLGYTVLFCVDKTEDVDHDVDC